MIHDEVEQVNAGDNGEDGLANAGIRRVLDCKHHCKQQA